MAGFPPPNDLLRCNKHLGSVLYTLENKGSFCSDATKEPSLVLRRSDPNGTASFLRVKNLKRPKEMFFHSNEADMERFHGFLTADANKEPIFLYLRVHKPTAAERDELQQKNFISSHVYALKTSMILTTLTSS